MQNIPFPSNDLTPVPSNATNDEAVPWQKLHSKEVTPMCFEIRQRNGEITTFPYSDFRGIRLLHAGHLLVNVYGMEKTQIIVHGRHLEELAKHLSLGRIHWFGETQKRNFELPETCPHITSIEFVLLS